MQTRFLNPPISAPIKAPKRGRIVAAILCVLRCCPSVASRGNIVARCGDTRNVSEDLSEKLFVSARHKCSSRGKTSQHLGNMSSFCRLLRLEAVMSRVKYFRCRTRIGRTSVAIWSSHFKSYIPYECCYTHCNKPRLSYANSGSLCTAYWPLTRMFSCNRRISVSTLFVVWMFRSADCSTLTDWRSERVLLALGNVLNGCGVQLDE